MNSMFLWPALVFGFACIHEIYTLPVSEGISKQLDNAVEKIIFLGQKIKDKEEDVPKVDPKTYAAADFAFTCSTCRMLFGIVETDVKNGKANEEIAASIVNLCVTFKIASEAVCRGAIHSFVNPIITILKLSGSSSKDLCGFVVGDKCEPSGFDKKYNWTVAPHRNPKPPVKPLKPPQNGSPTKRILHLSDTHLDLYYQEGSNAACDLPLCCRSSVGEPVKASDAAGKWGDYRSCDTPPRTLEHMMKHIAANETFDYIIWTGDLPPHDVYNQTKEGNVNLNHYLYTLFSNYFPKTPIFPALGNHETDPVNCVEFSSSCVNGKGNTIPCPQRSEWPWTTTFIGYPQPDITDPDHSIAWLYKELSKSWPKLMLQESGFSSDTILKGGYYSVLVEPGFRIISLNMNYGNHMNFWLVRDSKDPAEQLAWLTEELGKAEGKGEMVYLLGHIPPGSVVKIWGRNFRQIVNRFENTIAAQFYGHTHYDEVIVFHDDDLKRATSIAYVGPSTTTFAYVNPAYKIYTVDGDHSASTRMVLDGEGYYMDITEANLHDKPEWKKLYAFKESYGMKSLTPEDWSSFVRKLPTDEVLFQNFFNHLHRNSSTYPICDSPCAQQLMCRQMTAVMDDHSICKEMGIIPSTSLFLKTGFLSYDEGKDNKIPGMVH